MSALSDQDLDAILAIQLTVAWAGEGRCEPKRLGWWDTDLIDPAGGGDFFARLLPQTHAWAALEAAREAARRADAKARGKLANPDKTRSLFFLGFEVDEQLADRLTFWKRTATPPSAALPLRLALGAEFSADALGRALGGGDAVFKVVPNGRELKGTPPPSQPELVARLAAALVPLTEAYPLPFYALEG
jgi:hypothetical protein